MTRIEQIYCTHCTYGTSAIERREGEMASRVVGYSPRASSLEVNDLKKWYRNIERFMYYYLPDDTPGEEKLRLSAATAPRRFFYNPSVNGLKVLGQLSYRPTDTVGRPVSYFGHVLCGEASAGPWNVLDCLQLWGGAWHDEDSPGIDYALPPLSSLDELRPASGPPALDDHLLLSFLTAGQDAAWHDPCGIVPQRWKVVPASERSALFHKLLCAYLKVGPSRRENVLLVIEPAVAALLFYGVARLLPSGRLHEGRPTPGPREEISFSTFEPKTDRLLVSLAATDFFDAGASDLKPEAYRGRNYLYNTYNGKSCEPQSAASGYVDLMLGTLAQSGWAAVDSMLSAFQAAGAKTAADLESLARTHGWVDVLLDPGGEPSDLTWPPPTDKVALDYLAQVVRPRLADEATVARLLGTPNHLRVLTLVATEPPKRGEPMGEAICRLLEAVPEQDFPELLASPRIATTNKLAALKVYAHRHRQLPECDAVWTGPAERLLPELIEALSDDVLADVYHRAPPAHQTALLLKIAQAHGKHPLARKLIALLEDEPLCDLLRHHRPQLKTLYPALDSTSATLTHPNDPDLARRLERLLQGLPYQPAHFIERHNLLTLWKDCFAEPNKAGERLGAWNLVRQQLSKLADPHAGNGSGLLGKLLNKTHSAEQNMTKAGDALAKAIKEAMPDVEDPLGSIKATRLQELGKEITQRHPFLPPDAWKRVTNYLHYGDYTVFIVGESTAQAEAPGGFAWKPKPAARRGRRAGIKELFGEIGIETALLAAAIALPLCIGLYVFWRSTARSPTNETKSIEAVSQPTSTGAATSPSPASESTLTPPVDAASKDPK